MKTKYDLLIVGGGPAGLTAAIYAKRALLRIAVYEKEIIGGKLNKTGEIENYPGLTRIKGKDLALRIKEQVKKLGIKIIEKKVNEIKKKNDYLQLITNDGKKVLSRTVIIATGSAERKLEIAGEEKFNNKGVSYCAICDGFLFRGKIVTVIGGGYSGTEAALYLSKIATKVNLIHRGKSLNVDPSLIKKVEKNQRINVYLNSKSERINGDKEIESLVIKQEGKFYEIKTSAVFPCIGLIPNSSIVKNLFLVNERGEIKINDHFQTEVRGLFAIGDVTNKSNKQIVSASSDGSKVAKEVIKALST